MSDRMCMPDVLICSMCENELYLTRRSVWTRDSGLLKCFYVCDRCTSKAQRRKCSKAACNRWTRRTFCDVHFFLSNWITYNLGVTDSSDSSMSDSD